MYYLTRRGGYIVSWCVWVVVLLGSLVFFAPLSVHAQDSSPVVDQTASTTQTPEAASTNEINFANTLEMVLRALYLIMWPLLAIAGASLDNSLVYGEIFKLDVSLWQFWQIMRSFANFALGFMFVWSILRSFFSNNASFTPKSIITKIIIAAIAIQASWFMVAVVIDLSTVGIYGLGALPLTIIDINKDNKLNEVAYPVSHTMFDADQASSQSLISSPFSVYYTCPQYPGNSAGSPENVIMIPCWTKNGAIIRKGDKTETDSWDGYKENFVKQRNGAIKWKQITVDQISDDHCVWGTDIILMQPEKDLKTKEDIYKLKDPVGKVAATQWECPTLPKIMKKAVNATWPLFTLYSSILSIANLGFSPDKSGIVEITLEFLIKSIVGLLLLIPLFVLCIILIVRIVFLRLIIAVSPILVLGYVFDIKLISGGTKTSLGNVLWLIFLPVYVVFAIGMSLVFLTLVVKADLIQEKPLDVVSLVGGETTDCGENADGYKFLGMFDMCFTKGQKEFGAGITNIFAYLIVNGFAIGLMWAVVFAALRSSKITEGIVTTAEWFVKTMAMSVPFVPTPRWASSLTGLGDAKREIKSMPDRIQRAQYDNKIKDYLDSNNAQSGESKKTLDTQFHTAGMQWGSAGDIPTVIKNGAAPSTDRSQYREMPQAIWKRAAPSKTFNDMSEVLADPEVIERLQDTKMDDGKTLYEHLDGNWVKYRKWGPKRNDQKSGLYRMMKEGMNKSITDPAMKRELIGTWGKPIQYRYWNQAKWYMHVFDERTLSVTRHTLPYAPTGRIGDGTQDVIRERLTALWALISATWSSENFNTFTDGKYKPWLDELIWPLPDGNITRRTFNGVTLNVIYQDRSTPTIITGIAVDSAPPPSSTSTTTPSSISTPANSPTTSPTTPGTGAP